MLITGCFELTRHPTFGECAVADRDLAPGTVIIEERPAFVIDYAKDCPVGALPSNLSYKRKRGHMTLSRSAKESLAFAQVPEIAARLVDSFHVPDASLPSVQKTIAYKAAARGLAELRRKRDLFPEIHGLEDSTLINYSLLVSANAHAFENDSVACLEAGCKVTHTCFNPNVAVSLRQFASQEQASRSEVTMKHIALRSIKKGDILYGSYAKLTNYSIPERRKYLLNNKMFTCQCTHCTGKDLTRGLKCLSCLDRDLETTGCVVPLSTMYCTSNSDKNALWICQNCRTEKTAAEVLGQNSITFEDQESSIRSKLVSVESDDIDIPHRFVLANRLYGQALELFGWRHCLTASAAEAVLNAACQVIESSVSEMSADIDKTLSSFETLPALLEQWYAHLGVSPMEELSSVYLRIADHLMTLAAVHHEIISRAMEIVQSLLLKVRPLIEEHRAWPISHAMQEYYDELLFTLNDLVNGAPIQDGIHENDDGVPTVDEVEETQT